jgi:hypothetical protein
MATPQQSRSGSPANEDREEEITQPEQANRNTGGGFAGAFPHITPHQDVTDRDEPNDGRGQHARVSRKLREYWEANIPDEIKQFMVDDVFQTLALSPDASLLKTMCAKSKCMELLPPDDPGLLYLPTYGSTMCWLATGGAGELPGHIQDVLYFFAQVANSLGNYAHFVVPSTSTDVVVSPLFTPVTMQFLVSLWAFTLQVDRVDSKVIPSLISTGEGLEPRAPKRRRREQDEGKRFVSISEILAKRALDTSGEVRKIVPGVTLHLGNTAMVVKTMDGSERRDIYTVVMVRIISFLFSTRV